MYPRRYRGLTGIELLNEFESSSNSLVKGRDSIRLSADEVVEAVRRRGIDEAVTYPLACLDAGRGQIYVDRFLGEHSLFWYLGNQLEGFFDTLISDLYTLLQLGIVCIAVKPEDVVRVVGTNGYEGASTGPGNLEYAGSVRREVRSLCNLRF